MGEEGSQGSESRSIIIQTAGPLLAALQDDREQEDKRVHKVIRGDYNDGEI